MDLKQFEGLDSRLELVLKELGNLGSGEPSAYEDFTQLGGIILEARSEAKKRAKTIVGEGISGQYISQYDFVLLLDKYMEKAYSAGEKDSKLNKNNP